MLVTALSSVKKMAQKIVERFDGQISALYNEPDRKKGCVLSRDRQGIEHYFPLMTLSVAVTDSEKREITHYGRAVDIVAEIKKFLKSRPEKNASVYLEDRRKEVVQQ